MTEPRPKLTFSVNAQRIDEHGSLALCKPAPLTLDTDLRGRLDSMPSTRSLLARHYPASCAARKGRIYEKLKNTHFSEINPLV